MEINEVKESLDNVQGECNKLYAEYGATDNIITLQVAINRLRHEFDICDESECVYEEFVQ